MFTIFVLEILDQQENSLKKSKKKISQVFFFGKNSFAKSVYVYFYNNKNE